MKRALALLIALILLSAAALTFGSIRVNDARDKVVLTETASTGDISAARGLTVTSSAFMDGYLFWDTAFRPGAESGTVTDYAFSPRQLNEEYDYAPMGVQLMLYIGYFFSGSMGEPDTPGMGKLYKAVADNTAPGEHRAETLRFSDYYDFYPIFAELDIERFTGSLPYGLDEGMGPEQQAVADFFRIPVLPGHTIEISVDRNEAGEITGCGSSSGTDGPRLWTVCAVSEDACYFTFDARTEDGEGLVDTSNIPGGYGIYRLPFTETEGETTIQTDGLSMVYPLDPASPPTYLRYVPERRELLLITVEDGKCALTSIATDTMEQKQRLEVMDIPEGEAVWTFYQYEDFLVPVTSRELAVISHGENGYALDFTASLSQLAIENGVYYDAALAYDGERLALCSLTDRYGETYGSCCFELHVYSADGLEYSGRFLSSLDPGAPHNSQRCRLLAQNGLSISWE